MVSGVTDNCRISTDQSFWIDKLRELYLGHLPCKEFDQVVGNPSPIFQRCLDHPTPDDFWYAMVPSENQYASMDLPILTITGHYDICNRFALHHYMQHMRYASPSARARHYLVVGPWDHGGTREPPKEIGGVKLGDASRLDMNSLHKEWYDWTLKTGKKPEFLKKRVAYYMEGPEEWRYADNLDAVSKKKLILYLDSGHGEANDAFHSGLLCRDRPRMSRSDSYVYDPLDTRPADIEGEEIKNYNTDQRYCLNLFGNGLVYHSDPLAEDLEIAGTPRFAAWIAMDVPDTDFIARLFEIKPDGSSIALADATVRARHRKSLRNQELVKPHVINRYDFERFQFFARRISEGSRIRLMVGCPNSIYYQKNYNSGGTVADESGKDARTAHIRLYHEDGHRSRLELPIAV
jgi:hypothetical protein